MCLLLVVVQVTYTKFHLSETNWCSIETLVRIVQKWVGIWPYNKACFMCDRSNSKIMGKSPVWCVASWFDISWQKGNFSAYFILTICSPECILYKSKNPLLLQGVEVPSQLHELWSFFVPDLLWNELLWLAIGVKTKCFQIFHSFTLSAEIFSVGVVVINYARVQEIIFYASISLGEITCFLTQVFKTIAPSWMAPSCYIPFDSLSCFQSKSLLSYSSNAQTVMQRPQTSFIVSYDFVYHSANFWAAYLAILESILSGSVPCNPQCISETYIYLQMFCNTLSN